MNEFKSFYKTVKGNEGNLCYYPTRLDTYGRGCQHDCNYCYAKSLLDFRKLWDAENPAIADIEKIARKVKKLKKGSTVRLGGMTDCFQPIEQTYKITYQTIQELNNQGVHYLIVTKSDLVAADEYIQVMDKNLAHIQISVTGNDKFTSDYENTISLDKRIAAIEKLKRNGFDVSVRLSPFIPSLIDVDKINKIDCDKILVEFLRVNTWIKRWFGDFIDLNDYSLKHGGYNHLPLEKKIQYLDKIDNFEYLSVCEDVPDHYDYWMKNVNSNKNDCCNLRR